MEKSIKGQEFSILVMSVVLALILLALISCEKGEQPGHPANWSAQDSAIFDVKTGAAQTIILVEEWETGLWVYYDSVYNLPSYDVCDPGNGRSIYNRRYVVYVWIDAKWEYVGWHWVTVYNHVWKSALNQDFIELNQP